MRTVSADNINGLFALARAGHEGAEDRLFAILSERFGYLARHRIWDQAASQDVVQNAMVVVCREYKELNVEVSFAAWAHRVLDTRIKDYFRATQRSSRWMVPKPLADSDAVGPTDPVDLRLRLLDCLRKVGTKNRRYARILNLHHIGLETDEICRKLSLSTSALYVLLHRSRLLLNRCLETGGID